MVDFTRLNSEALEVLRVSKNMGMKPLNEYSTVAEARKDRSKLAERLTGEFDFQGKITRATIPSKNDTDGILALVYVPTKLKKDSPIVVYFHGGGFVAGSAEGYTHTCERLAQQCSIIIVNVDYRRAPEFKFPCMMDDGVEAVEWTKSNKIELGGTMKSKIGVAGDSAGGRIAGSICHDVSGIDFQILIYARTVYGKNLPSYKEFSEYPGLSDKAAEWYASHTFVSETDQRDPRIAIYDRERFDHLPPALFITAEIDICRDSSYVYAAKMLMAGVQTEIVTIKGTLHGFFRSAGVYRNSCAEAYKYFEDFVDRMYNMK